MRTTALLAAAICFVAGGAAAMDENLIYGDGGAFAFSFDDARGGAAPDQNPFEEMRQREGLTQSGESLNRFQLIRGLAQSMGVNFDPLSLFSPDREGRMDPTDAPFVPLSGVEVYPEMRNTETLGLNVTIPF